MEGPRNKGAAHQLLSPRNDRSSLLKSVHLRSRLIFIRHRDAFRIEPRVTIAAFTSDLVYVVVGRLVEVAEDGLVVADLLAARPDGAQPATAVSLHPSRLARSAKKFPLLAAISHSLPPVLPS